MTRQHLNNVGMRKKASRGGGRGVLPFMAVWMVFLWVLSLSAGCSSTGSPGVNSHAAVTIKGHEVTDVVLKTREVFGEHGFSLTGAETDRMIFERPSTTAEQVKYGSFGSSGVVIRAKVDLEEMGPETFFLRCDIFSVRDAGQSVLEDETRMMLMKTKPYQSILDTVKAELDNPGGVVDSSD